MTHVLNIPAEALYRLSFFTLKTKDGPAALKGMMVGQNEMIALTKYAGLRYRRDNLIDNENKVLLFPSSAFIKECGKKNAHNVVVSNGRLTLLDSLGEELFIQPGDYAQKETCVIGEDFPDYDNFMAHDCDEYRSGVRTVGFSVKYITLLEKAFGNDVMVYLDFCRGTELTTEPVFADIWYPYGKLDGYRMVFMPTMIVNQEPYAEEIDDKC